MKVAIIARSTLYEVPGGDTVQIKETARHLQLLGINAAICLTHQPIDYVAYDLFHFFNITRPADILYHIGRIKVPFVVSPILIDYSEYDRKHRTGISGLLFRLFSADGNEYLKTVSRWVKGNDSLRSKGYLLKGHRKSIRAIVNKAAFLLPNSASEYHALQKRYGVSKNHLVVPNGIDTALFQPNNNVTKDKDLVLCVARIEGIKNQLTLVKAVNNSSVRLVLAGSSAPNQKEYYNECRRIAGDNVVFAGQLSQAELVSYYLKAKVHVLPSWFETCGLSSLEAAAMGCNIVITGKGYTRDYFGDDAFYCDPASAESIRSAIEKAAAAESNDQLKERIANNYTWEKAAALTLEVYKKVLAR